ncbi:hypothetical protein HMPREF9103_02561 [Lentilactobacillus parafarraginis F0439]|uniref:Uncharacterized protein n=1 Tax=Lentilactobacillus parafarraginis F0439 TaxID=797515 RepID=G9ZS43_9LACO|nr:hypothetical protein HMPREF9103_02561 [Lentilactobacillus parafarraginis F0439]
MKDISFFRSFWEADLKTGQKTLMFRDLTVTTEMKPIAFPLLIKCKLGI